MTERGARYAYWPGTGPAGATCKSCEHYTITKASEFAPGGYCKKAAMYRNAKPITIPASTAACKYFREPPRLPPTPGGKSAPAKAA